MDLMTDVSSAFWNERFWLPSNYTWKDIEPGKDGVNYANFNDLMWSIPFAVVMMSIRYLMERFCFVPLGKSLGIKSAKPKPPQPNVVLEQTYKKRSKLNREMVLKLTKQLDLSDREIERWWRKRRALDRTTTLAKFCEHCWRFLAYFVSFAIGISALWDKAYLWDVLHCAYGYPLHAVDDGVWWYYMYSNAFYWSLTFSQFFDVKRKDLFEMVLHHSVCLILITSSWICNAHRVGASILLVHDCSDFILDAAKCFRYAKMKISCDVVFVLFTIVWIVTRLIFFPRIIYATMFQTFHPFFPSYAMFNALLVGLLILHVIWTYMIFRVLAKSLQSGIMDDLRSSSDESETEDEGKRK